MKFYPNLFNGCLSPIYLYDDRIVMVYNYNDLTEAITLENLEEKMEGDEPSTFVFDRVFGQMIYLDQLKKASTI